MYSLKISTTVMEITVKFSTHPLAQAFDSIFQVKIIIKKMRMLLNISLSALNIHLTSLFVLACLMEAVAGPIPDTVNFLYT